MTVIERGLNRVTHVKILPDIRSVSCWFLLLTAVKSNAVIVGTMRCLLIEQIRIIYSHELPFTNDE